MIPRVAENRIITNLRVGFKLIQRIFEMTVQLFAPNHQLVIRRIILTRNEATELSLLVIK